MRIRIHTKSHLWCGQSDPHLSFSLFVTFLKWIFSYIYIYSMYMGHWNGRNLTTAILFDFVFYDNWNKIKVVSKFFYRKAQINVVKGYKRMRRDPFNSIKKSTLPIIFTRENWSIPRALSNFFLFSIFLALHLFLL